MGKAWVQASCVALLAGCLVSACLRDFDFVADGAGGTSSSGGGAPGGSAPGGGAPGGGGEGGVGGTGGQGGGGGVPCALPSRGLLTRYFMDGAASGQGPTQLLDAAPDPLHLDIDYASNASWVESAAGQRGLAWTTENVGGAAFAPLMGTKLAGLDGTKTATLEVVLDVTTVSASAGNMPRFVYLGHPPPQTTARLGLVAATATGVRLRWRGNAVGQTDVPLGRKVIHVVIDTDQPAAAARGKIYVDGVAGVVTNPGIQLGSTLTLNSDALLYVGNRPTGSRSPEGAIHYVAIYDQALGDDEIACAAGILSASDDSP